MNALPSSPLFLLLLAAALSAQSRPTGARWATRSEVIARSGMVCTSQPLATQAGVATLKRGGSAVDAAVAANAVLALTEPTGCGLGGDLFAIVWDANGKKLHGFNGSGRSPKSLTLESLTKILGRQGRERIPALGPLPVTVPGCVDGWCELHARFGKLPLAEVLAPAIHYARTGFPVTEVIARHWQAGARRLSVYPNFASVFLPDGRAPGKGDLFRNPALASTLERIASGGRDAFYGGEIARNIASYVREQGGFLTEEDLAAHHGEWVEPVSTSYRGYEVWELPPNGQGIAVLQMLNILEHWDLRAMGFGSADYLHRLVEAKKLAFEDRARFYADPAFVTLPVKQLIDKKYAETRRQLIDPEHAAASYEGGNPARQDGDTVYLCAADEAGNMVSLIQSNYRGMGSGMTPPDLGFVLQDRGELFDLTPGRPNTYAPGKRPFHTIIPAFVTKDGEPWLCFGVMGGAMQPQGHVQILVNMIDFGMNTQEAGDAPRVRHDGSSEPTGERMADGGTVAIEPGIDDAVISALRARGHRVVGAAGDFGGYQAIRYDARRRVYFGASESRKDGQAAGY